MKTYFDIIDDILENGQKCKNRTGIDTLSVFGRQYRYNMVDGFPILTTRTQPFRKILGEVIWYIRGDASVDYLQDHDIKVWDKWVDEESNSIGPMYPTQLRNINGLDQLARLERNLQEFPDSRRHIISFWNPNLVPDEGVDPIESVKQGKMALAPCIVLLQFNCSSATSGKALENALNHPLNDSQARILANRLGVGRYTLYGALRMYKEDKRKSLLKEFSINTDTLSLMVTQRSWDVGAAGGWNVSQYALLLHMLAHVTGRLPTELIHNVGDAHIYENQIPVLREQMTREPFPLPTLEFTEPYISMDSFRIDSFTLKDYKHHPYLHIPVAY